MNEPLATVIWLNAISSTSCNSLQGVSGARRVTTYVLLLQRPARLYRVKVWRVRRKVDDTHTFRIAQRYNARIVMCFEIVEYQHISDFELWQQPLGQPQNEAFCICGRVHCAEQYPAGDTDSTEEREVCTPVHGNPLDVLIAFLHPGVTSRHGGVEPRFVDKHQFGDRYASDFSQKRCPFLHDVRPKLLQRPVSFFFTTKPARRRARLILETWRRDFPRRPLLYSAVISPAVASPNRDTISSNSCKEMSERRPPPFLRGHMCPSRRFRAVHRRTEDRLTANFSAIVPYPPSPASYAATTRSRNSIGCASAMPMLDPHRDRHARNMVHSIEQWV